MIYVDYHTLNSKILNVLRPTNIKKVFAKNYAADSIKAVFAKSLPLSLKQNAGHIGNLESQIYK